MREKSCEMTEPPAFGAWPEPAPVVLVPEPALPLLLDADDPHAVRMRLREHSRL
jgi:hypothetical protein